MDSNFGERKNIIFVTVGLGGGGSERVMSVLANKFVEKGNNVTFLMLKSDKIDYKLDSRIKIEKYLFNGSKNILGQIKFIRKHIKQQSECTIISFFTYQSFISIISKIGIKSKVIVSERNDPRKTVYNKKINIIRNFLYSFADKVVFQTEDAKNLFPINIKNKSIIIPNPLNDNLPKPFIGERTKKFVAFSRLNEQKNIYMMIDACKKVFNKYKEYYLDIYGVGELENDLKNYVKRQGLVDKINFKGFTKNVHDNIKDATAFLSSSDYEGVSNSMIEAMAIGLPCICTDCPIGGARMFINNNKNGILVEVNNCDDMANAMEKIIENKELRNTLSRNSISIKKELSSDNIVEKWIDLL